MIRLPHGFGGRAVALAATLAVAGVGLARGTWAVGGSDSSCYALMADAMAHGRLQPTSRLAVTAPWPEAPLTLAPGGFVPSRVRADAASPVCAAGMSLLAAPLLAVGGRDTLFLLSPAAAAALVWLASVLAFNLAGGLAGGTAAVLVAASPIVVFQAVQPMNDVLTAALWVGAVAVAAGERRRKAVAAGVLAGLAALVRPNLAPLVVPVAAMASAGRGRAGAAAEAGWFACGLAPGVVALLLLNQALYGSPLASGYGDPSALFSVSHVRESLAGYLRAVVATETLFPAVAVLAPFVLDRARRRLAWTLLATAAVAAAPYLVYRPFPEWWYLRFLIVALVLGLVLASAVLARLAGRFRMGGVAAAVAAALAATMLATGGAREAMALETLEGRYRATAALVAERLPERAVLVTVWQSGGMRFHARREAVLWDSLDPAWLDRAVAWLAAEGRPPFILLERREEREFRDRFGPAGGLGALDWPPRFDVGRQVRIWDPADRARYLAGEAYITEHVRQRR